MNQTQTDATGWEYSPAPETTQVRIEPKNKLFINGQFVSPKSRSWFSTTNPANNEKLADIACAGKADVESAVTSAKKALPKWSKLPGSERAKYLYRIARRIQERSRELAILETMDGGKPIKESRDVDLPLVAQHFFYYAGWADKLQYAFPGAHIEPVGVCAQIIPWNFPLLMAAWKLASALDAGCSCIVKKAEHPPLAALKLAQLAQESGGPDGVLSVVVGVKETTGQAMWRHHDINIVCFTGSTKVGGYFLRYAGESNPKSVVLEIGDKRQFIILDDADLTDDLNEHETTAAFWTSGQTCSANIRQIV